MIIRREACRRCFSAIVCLQKCKTTENASSDVDDGSTVVSEKGWVDVDHDANNGDVDFDDDDSNGDVDDDDDDDDDDELAKLQQKLQRMVIVTLHLSNLSLH